MTALHEEQSWQDARDKWKNKRLKKPVEDNPARHIPAPAHNAQRKHKTYKEIIAEQEKRSQKFDVNTVKEAIIDVPDSQPSMKLSSELPENESSPKKQDHHNSPNHALRNNIVPRPKISSSEPVHSKREPPSRMPKPDKSVVENAARNLRNSQPNNDIFFNDSSPDIFGKETTTFFYFLHPSQLSPEELPSNFNAKENLLLFSVSESNEPPQQKGFGFGLKGYERAGGPIIVNHVVSNGRSDLCSLKVGDRILIINGKKVESLNHTELVKVMSEAIQSGSLCLRVLREGHEVTCGQTQTFNAPLKLENSDETDELDVEQHNKDLDVIESFENPNKTEPQKRFRDFEKDFASKFNESDANRLEEIKQQRLRQEKNEKQRELLRSANQQSEIFQPKTVEEIRLARKAQEEEEKLREEEARAKWQSKAHAVLDELSDDSELEEFKSELKQRKESQLRTLLADKSPEFNMKRPPPEIKPSANVQKAPAGDVPHDFFAAQPKMAPVKSNIDEGHVHRKRTTRILPNFNNAFDSDDSNDLQPEAEQYPHPLQMKKGSVSTFISHRRPEEDYSTKPSVQANDSTTIAMSTASDWRPSESQTRPVFSTVQPSFAHAPLNESLQGTDDKYAVQKKLLEKEFRAHKERLYQAEADRLEADQKDFDEVLFRTRPHVIEKIELHQRFAEEQRKKESRFERDVEILRSNYSQRFRKLREKFAKGDDISYFIDSSFEHLNHDIEVDNSSSKRHRTRPKSANYEDEQPCHNENSNLTTFSSKPHARLARPKSAQLDEAYPKNSNISTSTHNNNDSQHRIVHDVSDSSPHNRSMNSLKLSGIHEPVFSRSVQDIHTNPELQSNASSKSPRDGKLCYSKSRPLEHSFENHVVKSHRQPVRNLNRPADLRIYREQQPHRLPEDQKSNRYDLAKWLDTISSPIDSTLLPRVNREPTNSWIERIELPDAGKPVANPLPNDVIVAIKMKYDAQRPINSHDFEELHRPKYRKNKRSDNHRNLKPVSEMDSMYRSKSQSPLNSQPAQFVGDLRNNSGNDDMYEDINPQQSNLKKWKSVPDTSFSDHETVFNDYQNLNDLSRSAESMDDRSSHRPNQNKSFGRSDDSRNHSSSAVTPTDTLSRRFRFVDAKDPYGFQSLTRPPTGPNTLANSLSRPQQQEQQPQSQNSHLKKPRVSKKTLCHKCKTPFGKSSVIIIEPLQMHLHESCFLCGSCNAALKCTDLQTEVLISGNDLLCTDCYNRDYNNGVYEYTPC